MTPVAPRAAGNGGPPGTPPRSRRDVAIGAAIAAGTAAVVVIGALSGRGGGDLAGLTTIELVAILAGGALGAAAVLGARDARVPGGWVLAAFAALAVLTSLSLLWSIDPATSWLEANRTLAYAAVFGGAIALVRLAPQQWPSLAGGLLLGTSIVCAYALLSKIAPEWLNETERFARLREPLQYWNAVGLAGALAVPGALWLGARRDGPPLINALAFPALALALTTMLLALSRGSLLAAGVGAALWFALVPLRLRGAIVLLLGGAAALFMSVWSFGQDALTEDGTELAERSAAGHELLILVVAVLGLVYAAGLVATFVADAHPLQSTWRRRAGIALLVGLALAPLAGAAALSRTDDGIGGSVSSAWRSITDPDAAPPSNEPGRLTAAGSLRARYWDDAFRMLDDRPVAGLGAGGYATARPRYRRDTLDVRRAHGYVPQTLADLGLLGLALSLAAAVAWVLAARRSIRGTEGRERVGIVTLAATAVVFGVHSFVDWTWFIPATAVVGLLAAGWVAGRGAGAPPARRDLRPAAAGRVRQALAGAAVLLALVAAWSAWQPLRADHAADAAVAAAADRRFDDARRHAERAHDINPLAAEPLLVLADVERRAGRRAAAEDALEEAVRTQRANYQPWLRLAEFQLWEADRPRDALRSVRAALYLNPSSFEVIQRYLDVSRTLRNRRASAGRR